jgi:enoyl-CoA hydratase/carnithine racemase
MAALLERLREAESDTSVRVVVIRAEGKVFSAGHDLRELHGGCETDYAGVFALCTELMETIRLLPKPVIAQVDGLATAAGCQLVATCDLAVCTEESAFATPGVKVGLFCTTPGVAVARTVPQKTAMEMLLTAEPISAQDALRAGLVNRIVPRDALESTVRGLASHIAGFSAEVVALGKAAFYRQIDMNRPEAYAYAEGVMVDNLTRPDANEGIGAFIEKRAPKWIC